MLGGCGVLRRSDDCSRQFWRRIRVVPRRGIGSPFGFEPREGLVFGDGLLVVAAVEGRPTERVASLPADAGFPVDLVGLVLLEGTGGLATAR